MGLSILDLVRSHAAQAPDAPCLSFEMATLSYRDLHARASRVANALARQGVKAGDRVALIARNSPAHYELLFGCGMIGAILLPVNWRLAPGEVAGILADAEPSLLLVEADFRHLLADAELSAPTLDLHSDFPDWRDAAAAVDTGRPIAPDAPALMLYTSGTTGRPKGAVLSHENLSYMNRMAGELWHFTADSVNLAAMPLFHIGGIGYSLSAFGVGGHTVLMQQVNPAEIVEAIRRYRVTHGFFVPTVIQMLLEVPGVAEMDLGSLKCMLYGGAPIGEAVLKRAIELFRCGFIHCYGMTETAGTVITLVPEDHDPGGPLAHRLRSCGLPMPWVELALVDPETDQAVQTGAVGEIRIRSKVNMLGYWNKPEESAKTIKPDGWLCTGDAAWQDDDGYVYIHDRFKDMIVSGGENIYPTEIENVLYDHPGVAAAAVIGVAHERWGETPRAFVVARDGVRPSEAELIAFTRERLAHYKCPTSVAFVSALPQNASGKILKKEMRDPRWLEEHS
jgi:acyl-CoA synthetase (AMP-forming)/AMP-acid ligase II